MAFRAFVPGSPDVSIWTGTGLHDLELVADTVATTALQPVVVTFSTFGPPVINDSGDVAFIAVDQIFTEGVWSSLSLPVDGSLPTVVGILPIVQEGDDAPGTIGAVFAGFDSTVNVAINKAGRVAFVGLLDINSPGVTFENQRGIWAEDPNGALTLIAREGRFLEVSSQGETTILDRVNELSFAGGSGNADGRPSGFSDNGEVTFRATFNDGTSGIFRATFQGIPQPQPTGEEFIWNDEACALKTWHANCGRTNWNDKDGNPQRTSPGDKGDEVVTIINASVFLTDRAATIGSLNATGKLEVQQDLTLAEDSNIEAIQLLGGNLTSNGNLRITGTSLWQSGTISSGDEGMVTHSGTLDIVQAATGDPPKKIAGTKPFSNEGTICQFDDIELTNAKIDNKASGVWQLKTGGLTTVGLGSGTFINRGKLEKPVNDEAADSDNTPIVQSFVQAEAGSRLEVRQGALRIQRGMEFLGDSTIFVSGNRGSRLLLEAVGGAGEYRVSPNTTVDVTSETEVRSVGLGLIFLEERAVLNVQEGAVFQTADGTAFFLGGGQINGPGAVRFGGLFTWGSGTVGLLDVGFDSADVLIRDGGRMIIGSVGEHKLAGTLTVGEIRAVGDPLDLPGVTQFGDIAIDGGRVVFHAGTWTVTSGDITATANGVFIITKGAVRRRNEESPRVHPVSATLSVDSVVTVNLSARLNNNGIVEVRGGTLNVTGPVTQLSNNILSAGTWIVEDSDGRLNLPSEVHSIGHDCEVVLRNVTGSAFPQLKVNTVDGLLLLNSETALGVRSFYSAIGSLTINGKVFLSGSQGSILSVPGLLTNNKVLEVCADSVVAAPTFIFTRGSRTIIDGVLSGPGGRNAQLVEMKGSFYGVGTINGQRFDQQGRLRPGRSPGVLTVNGNYTQSPEAILEIDIGGTTPEIEHAQLVVNGNVELGGTLRLKFIDDFSPQAGQTFDFLAASGTQTGEFENVEIVDLAPGFEFEVTPTDVGMMMTAMTDGVFTGIVGEINDIAVGRETPEAQTTAVPGEPNVPMLQFDIVPEGDGLTLNQLTLQADGSGNDVTDLIGVTLWADEDGDGRVGFDEPAIGSGIYQADNGTLDLAVDPPHNVPARQTATLLLTYDIAAGEEQVVAAARNVNDKAASPRSHLSFGLGAVLFAIALTLTIGLSLLAGPKGRAGILAGVLLLTGASIAGCPPDLTGGGLSTVTFQVTLRAIGASEAGTNADASVDNLSLTGTTLTVLK